jgi:hypothetical protein
VLTVVGGLGPVGPAAASNLRWRRRRCQRVRVFPAMVGLAAGKEREINNHQELERDRGAFAKTPHHQGPRSLGDPEGLISRC